jgi:hypothetical protein
MPLLGTGCWGGLLSEHERQNARQGLRVSGLTIEAGLFMMSTSEANEPQVRVNAWLRGLGARTGLDLHLSLDGVCAIGHISGLECVIEVPPDGGQVWLRLPILQWAGQSPELAVHCLQQNLLGIGAEAASLALDTTAGELLLWLVRPLDALDEDRLGLLILDLFACAQECREGLENFVRVHAVQDNPHLEREPAVLRG